MTPNGYQILFIKLKNGKKNGIKIVSKIIAKHIQIVKEQMIVLENYAKKSVKNGLN